MTTKAEPPQLATIDAAVEKFAAEHSSLQELISKINEESLAIHRKHRRQLTQLMGRVIVARTLLHSLLSENRTLFQKPKTRVLHGVKIGFSKGKGKVEIGDADKTVALIRKHLADMEEVLIRSKYTPDKEALEKLPADQLKKIGVTITETGDKVLIQPIDSDFEKMVNKILEQFPDSELGSEVDA